jgi:coniferyl-aldehyde dehydrogenase
MKNDATEALHLQLETCLQHQRAAFLRDAMPSHKTRHARIQKIRDMAAAYEQRLVVAVSADFGHRSTHETRLTELLVLDATAKHAQRHLAGWMKPKSVKTALHFLPGTNTLMPQPLGVVGVISPWNYPVLLALSPVIAAFAAGNRAMLKPSELTPRTSALLADAVAEFFDEDEFSVINGDASVARAFASLRFDHLFFTGSTPVGRQVAQQAAANLVPVTLELGGKSPAIVHHTADIELTAERLAHGKLLNAGQTCVAPDYVLAPLEMVEPLAQSGDR